MNKNLEKYCALLDEYYQAINRDAWFSAIQALNIRCDTAWRKLSEAEKEEAKEYCKKIYLRRIACDCKEASACQHEG